MSRTLQTLSYLKHIPKFKTVDIKDELVVFGYIRNEQITLESTHSNIAFYTITALIIHEILLYYNDREYFKIISKNVISSENETTITNNFASTTSSYGTKVIKSTINTIHKWKFYIHNELQCVAIGIEAYPVGEFTDKAFHYFTNKINYAYRSFGCFHSEGKSDYSDAKMFTSGNTVEMILNLFNNTLYYKIDSEHTGVAYKIKTAHNLEYVMCVAMAYNDDKVSLIDYECINDINYDKDKKIIVKC
eukprot:7447_1